MEQNGFAKGLTRRANGKMNGKMNGHAVIPPIAEKTNSAGKTLVVFRWLVSSVARLFTWYAIISIVFRCPASLEACDDQSPAICAPYLRSKIAVAPYLKPYYQTYAVPYVDTVRPYYEAVDTSLVTPGRNLAGRYVAPRVAGTQAFVQDRWERTVQPQLSKYRNLAHERYDQTIVPHIQHISGAVLPYWEIVKSNLIRSHHEVVLPAYRIIRPHVSYGYGVTATATTDTVIPLMTRGWDQICLFLDGAVWPKIRALYIKNVEPQLIRIGERLGRYKHGEKVENEQNTVYIGNSKSGSLSIPGNAASSSSSTSLHTLSVQSPIQSSLSAATSSTVLQSASKSQTSSPTGPDASTETRSPQQIVADDIVDAREKVKQAANEGSIEVSERIVEVVDELISSTINGDGDAIVGELQLSIEATITNLREEINEIAGRAASDMDKAREDVGAAVRRAGLTIKQKSQAVRKWRQQFENELQAAITKAVRNNIRILEEIGDLALQKIGMKWAWMDGVTWRDWKLYHELRANVTAWTDGVKKLIVDHDAIVKAQSEASELEDIAMDMAQAAAKELVRLKQVGFQKAELGDNSDKFDIGLEEQAPLAEPDTIAEGPEVVSLEEPLDHDIPDKIDQTVRSPDHGETASSDLLGAQPSMVGNISDKQDDVADEDEDEDEESLTEEPVYRESAATDAGYAEPVFMGAAAQAVPEREPIPDDTDLYISMTSGAQEMFSQAMSRASAQYSTAISIVSGQIYGTPQPVHEQLFASITSVYSVATASASSQLDNVLDVASKGVYGTTTTNNILPTDWARIEAIAAEKLNEGRVWAELRYESAKVALGLATPTPTSSTDKLLQQAKQNYYAGIGMAHERYTEFIAAMSSAVHSMTATPTPTAIGGHASSLVSVAGGSVASAASFVGDEASLLVSAASSGASSLVAAGSESVASAIDIGWEKASDAGKASADSLEVIVSHISVRIYGEPTHVPWYEEITERVAEGVSAVTSTGNLVSIEAERQFAAVSAIVSELIVGKEPSFAESVLSRLHNAYSTLASEAGENVAKATQGVKERFKDEL